MKYILFTLSVFLCGVVAVGYVFVLGEIYASLSTIATADAQVVAVERQEAEARAAQLFTSDTSSLQSELDAFVAHDTDIVAVIDSIEATAKREKITLAIAAVAVGSQSKWKRHEPVNVTMTANGSFSVLAAFITALETLPRAARVENFAIETIGTGWFGTLQISFVKEKTTAP